VFVEQPLPLEVTATSTPSTCGESNGSITATASGGTEPYEYNLNGGEWQTSNLFTDLAPVDYTVNVKDDNGCTAATSITVEEIGEFDCDARVTYEVNYFNGQDNLWCPMVNNTLSASVSLNPGESISNMSWSVTPDTWNITSGSNSTSITFDTDPDCTDLTATFTFSFRINYPFGGFCDVSCTKEVTAVLAYEHCTATQGFWGNTGGSFCGQTSEDILAGLLATTSLTVGRPGHSYTTRTGTEGAACVAGVLPSSGTSTFLEDDYDCSSGPPKPKCLYKNTLFGQTLTLGLNLRWDLNLYDVVLEHIMLVSENSSGACGSPPSPQGFETITIPQNVLDYLSAHYGGATIGSLMEFANDALGNIYIPSQGNPTYGDITAALSACNLGLDFCKWMTDEGGEYTPPAIGNNGNGNDNAFYIHVNAYPNPFEQNLTIEVEFSREAEGRIDIYNMMGTKVAQLANGKFSTGEIHTYVWKSDRNMPEGVYLISVSTASGTKQLRVVFTR
jgi:hypothetical protein